MPYYQHSILLKDEKNENATVPAFLSKRHEKQRKAAQFKLHNEQVNLIGQLFRISFIFLIHVNNFYARIGDGG